MKSNTDNRHSGSLREERVGSSDLLALIQNGDELRIRLHGELNLDNHSSLRSLLEEVLKKTNQQPSVTEDLL